MTKFPLDSKGLPSIEAIHREAKTRIVDDAIRNVPEFNEESLREFYSSVVLSGAAEEVKQGLAQIEAPGSHRPTSKGERAKLFQTLRARLEAPVEDAEEGAPAPPSLIPALPESTPTHVALTAALINLAPAEPRGPTTIPLGIVRKGEWQALLDGFVSKRELVFADSEGGKQ